MPTTRPFKNSFLLQQLFFLVVMIQANKNTEFSVLLSCTHFYLTLIFMIIGISQDLIEHAEEIFAVIIELASVHLMLGEESITNDTLKVKYLLNIRSLY